LIIKAKRDRRSEKRPPGSVVYRNYRAKLRRQAIAAMGGCCQDCGFADQRALQFDHVTPIRRGRNGLHKSAHTSDKVHRAVMRGQREGLRLLCANCHQIKTRADEDSGLSMNGPPLNGALAVVIASQIELDL
jgi:5-methylcytosine-specific restriction endonuclease McrA